METKKNVCIYRLTHRESGKVYIGQTCDLSRTQSFLYSAIQKYGWASFDIGIIEEGLTREDANQREVFWIDQYQSNQQEFGYNLSSGGKAGSPSESTRLKLSVAGRGRVDSEETKQLKSSSRIEYLSDDSVRCKLSATFTALRKVEIPEFATDDKGKLRKVVDRAFSSKKHLSPWHCACNQKFQQINAKRRFWLEQQERTRYARLSAQKEAS